MRVKFIAEKTTKNMVVYTADREDEGNEGVLGKVYVPKAAAREKAPPGHEFPEFLYLPLEFG